MLFRRREVLLPTPAGWLLLLAVVALAAILVGRALPDLLTVDEPARGRDGRGAKTLVVEGWLEARDLERALPVIRSGRYQRVLTTGGPIESWDDAARWPSYAERAAAYLTSQGTGGLAISAVAAPPTEQRPHLPQRARASANGRARQASASMRSTSTAPASIRADRARSTGWPSVRRSRSACSRRRTATTCGAGGRTAAARRRCSAKPSASRGPPAASGHRRPDVDRRSREAPRLRHRSADRRVKPVT